jgi:hypothetical protein
MSWRPDGWNFRNIALRFCSVTLPQEAKTASEIENPLIAIYKEAIEAGADAMLEALRKTGSRIDVDNYPANFYASILLAVPTHGNVIFVPDDKVKKEKEVI